jgi:GNAT superfamily N-acetyltransferase
VIRPLAPSDVAGCAAVLERLPQWFGIEAANAAYIESLHRLPGFVAERDGSISGFLAIELHTVASAEITVMGVDPDLHRQGIGRELFGAALGWCRARGVRWLHVKTRGPSTYDDDYERTRRFYLALGFEPLYESRTEWGPENAALILVLAVDQLDDASSFAQR